MFRQNVTPTNWLNKQSCDEKGYCFHQLDSSEHIIDINQAWLTLTGYKAKDVIGKSIHEFITPSSELLPQQLTSPPSKIKKSNSVCFSLKRQNQEITNVVLFSAPEYTQTHQFIGTQACFAPFEFFAQNKQHFLDLLSDMNEQQSVLREHSHYLGDILNALDSFVMAFKGQKLISVNQPVLRFFACDSLIEVIETMPTHVYQELTSWQQEAENNQTQDDIDFVHIKSPVTQEIHHFDVSHFIIENDPSNCITVLTDVTEKLKIKAQFNSEKELSSEYLNIAKIMILALDLQGNVTQINRAGCELLGYPRNKIIGKNWFDEFIPEKQKTAMLGYFNELIEGDDQTHFNNENLIVTKEGAQRLVSSNNTVLRNAAGEIIGSLSSAEDITDLKQSQEELAFLAHHDVLTGLDNRNSLQQRILQAIKKSQRSKNCFALCFIDLDNFKFINDSYGHKAGDELLIAVSKLIKKTVRDSDAVARFGGDEFVILLEDIEHNSEVSLIADKLLKAFSNPIHFDSHNLVITISMGVSVYPQDATTLDLLLKNADIAMYEAKRKGKNRYALYNKQMASDAINRATTIQELTKAITDGHIGVYYQPIINQITQKPVGIEALARWHHPSRGLTLPDEFIPIAEEAGLIIPLGEQILCQACNDIAALHDDGLFDGYVSVNVSGEQIEHSKFYKMLKNTLKETNIKPSMLEIEITESVVMSNPEQWNTLFDQLKSIGLKIAIDDFGTGFSSLSQLSQLSLDKLKIDKSFIHRLDNDEKARTVAQAIISLSHSMNMTSIAEGVETEAQKAFLNQQNCDVVQGFLFAKPMNLTELKEWFLDYKKHSI
ncbi:hypothetical protein JCM30760_18820 [Thiomicrorhabdus hydrogeniphila]